MPRRMIDGCAWSIQVQVLNQFGGSHIKAIVLAAKAVEEQMPVDLLSRQLDCPTRSKKIFKYDESRDELLLRKYEALDVIQ